MLVSLRLSPVVYLGCLIIAHSLLTLTLHVTSDPVGIIGPPHFGLWSNVSACLFFSVKFFLADLFDYRQFHLPAADVQTVYAVSENSLLRKHFPRQRVLGPTTNPNSLRVVRKGKVGRVAAWCSAALQN